MANNVQSSLIITADEVDSIQAASIYSECASMRTKIVIPWNDPAILKCNLAQGLDSHFQGLSDAGV